MTTPKPWLAMLLSLVLPGAGLAYCGKWLLGLLNLLLVEAVILVVWVIGEPTVNQHIHYVVLALHAASAGYAHAVALTAKRKAADT